MLESRFAYENLSRTLYTNTFVYASFCILVYLHNGFPTLQYVLIADGAVSMLLALSLQYVHTRFGSLCTLFLPFLLLITETCKVAFIGWMLLDTLNPFETITGSLLVLQTIATWTILSLFGLSTAMIESSTILGVEEYFTWLHVEYYFPLRKRGYEGKVEGYE